MYLPKNRPQRLTIIGILLTLTIGLGSAAAIAQTTAAMSQEPAETIRVNTRVVFLDALVKDKRTGVPISDLKLENFEVLDNGSARPISYFTREGQARKPLAIILILDLRDDGAGRFLKQPEILKAMSDALAKLSPEDEIAILAMDIGEDEKRVWLSGFTRDRAALIAALFKAPQFLDADPEDADARASLSKNNDADHGSSVTVGSGSSNAPARPADTAGNSNKQADRDVVNVEVTKGKNGAVTTRTTRRDGSIDVKRVNKKGNVTVELGDIYDLRAAVGDAVRMAQSERPNSQASIVWVSDGITPVFFEDRDATEQLVLRENVIFNSLTVEMRTLFKLLMPVGKPIAGIMGLSVHGSAKRLAQQSGGEAVKVSRPKDYLTGLSKIFGNLTARYSLGFALAESEQDDGKLHNLEVRVKAADEKGKLRKLQVSSRQGYFMSETAAPSASGTTAVKAQ